VTIICQDPLGPEYQHEEIVILHGSLAVPC